MHTVVFGPNTSACFFVGAKEKATYFEHKEEMSHLHGGLFWCILK